MNDAYWERRHKGARGNGRGSEGDLLAHKQRIVDHLLARVGANSLLDLGCGDGSLAEGIHVDRYVGVDVSLSAVRRAQWRIEQRGRYDWAVGLLGQGFELQSFDVAISMDVTYHLLDQNEYDRHLKTLFRARKAVGIYAPPKGLWRWLLSRHITHRPFVEDITRRFPEWGEWYRMGPPWPGLSKSSWVVWRRDES